MILDAVHSGSHVIVAVKISIVSFHGSNIEELETGFHEAVDGYLEISEKTGRLAQKPFSGNLMLRIHPDIHAAVATAAAISGKSINQWAAQVLDQATHQ